MRILLTGASSFSGTWFANALAKAGHEVVAIFRGTPESYRDVRAKRVGLIRNVVDTRWETVFGDSGFIDLLKHGRFDLICHHASEVAEYRSWDFDPIAAAQKNMREVRSILSIAKSSGCRGFIYTGTVFEPFEGLGDSEQRAFNPYGLSKHMSFEILRMEAKRVDFPIGKFVIPNPFGPFEEPRFTSYLAREWAAGHVPKVSTPHYVRDNIHVSLLSLAYRKFCENFDSDIPVTRCAPCGYIESQGSFAHRLAREIGGRCGRPCALDIGEQSDYSEPMFRTNGQLLHPAPDEWKVDDAWDALADYYREAYHL